MENIQLRSHSSCSTQDATLALGRNQPQNHCHWHSDVIGRYRELIPPNMHERMHARAHTHTCSLTGTHTHTNTCTTRVSAHGQTFTQTHTRTCARTYMPYTQTLGRLFVRRVSFAHAHKRTYACMHARTHTSSERAYKPDRGRESSSARISCDVASFVSVFFCEAAPILIAATDSAILLACLSSSNPDAAKDRGGALLLLSSSSLSSSSASRSLSFHCVHANG